MALQFGYQIAFEYQEARSAREPKTRPVFESLMADIENGKVTGLLCWHVNRLSRNPVDGGAISYLLLTGKLQFIHTPERKFLPQDSAVLLAVEYGMATAFIQDLRRNVLRGLRGKLERGWYPGRAPIGYLNNPYTREIDPDPETFDTVRKAWELVLGGSTISEVCQELSEAGLRRTSNRRKPTRLATANIYSLFRNPFYAGLIRYKGETYSGRHRAMVSQSEYADVQRRLDKPDRSKKQKRFFPYAGLIVCETCGCAVVGEERRKYYRGTNRYAIYRYYHCSGSKGCSKRGIKEEALIEIFSMILEMMRISDSFVAWCKDALKEQTLRNSERDGNILTSTARAQYSVEKRLAGLLELRIGSEISAEQYAKEKAEAEEELRQLARRMSVAESEHERTLHYINGKLDVASEASFQLHQTPKGQRLLLRALIEKCTLNLEYLTVWFDPILQEIATFEPMKQCSQTLLFNDSLHSNPVWCSLIDRLRTLGLDVIRRDSASNGEVIKTLKASAEVTQTTKSQKPYIFPLATASLEATRSSGYVTRMEGEDLDLSLAHHG